VPAAGRTSTSNSSNLSVSSISGTTSRIVTSQTSSTFAAYQRWSAIHSRRRSSVSGGTPALASAAPTSTPATVIPLLRSEMNQKNPRGASVRR